MTKVETRKMVLAAAEAGAEKKAEDTRILELDPSESGFTDFFLIMSGSNTRQVVAIADEIEMRMKREFGTYANSVEGKRQSEWVLMDYVDFVVHIFVAEKRAYYDIERLRKSATTVDIEQLKIALAEKVAVVRKKAAKSATKKAIPKTVSKAPAKKAVAKKAAAKKAPAKRVAAKPVAAKKASKKAAKKQAK